MSNKEVEEMFYAVHYLQDLLLRTYSDASDAYEVLFNHESDVKYGLSLSYLSMSYQSFLEMQRVHHNYKFGHYEIVQFFSAYENFKFQLKQVITQKDTNTSWLSSQFDSLTDSKQSPNEFISNWIKNTMKQK